MISSRAAQDGTSFTIRKWAHRRDGKLQESTGYVEKPESSTLTLSGQVISIIGVDMFLNMCADALYGHI
jgi:hypothetical protein